MGCDGGNCGGTPSVVFGYVGTAILLKFLFGIDDVVWLAPFMAREVSHEPVAAQQCWCVLDCINSHK